MDHRSLLFTIALFAGVGGIYRAVSGRPSAVARSSVVLLTLLMLGSMTWQDAAFGAITPTEGQMVPAGTVVTAPCSSSDDELVASWIVTTVSPARPGGRPVAGEPLAPLNVPPTRATQNLPPPGYTFVDGGNGGPLYGAMLNWRRWVWDAEGFGYNGSNSDGCDAVSADNTALANLPGSPSWGFSDGWWTGESSASSTGVELNRPGPYVLEQIHGQGINAPETVTHFFVVGKRGRCADKRASLPYINQYAAEAAKQVPRRAGESACGPASMLMGMFRELGTAEGFPSLRDLYSKTLNADKNFDPNLGWRWLRKHGWPSAKIINTGSDDVAVKNPVGPGEPGYPGYPIFTNLDRIDLGLDRGPVLVSTAFSNRPWGTAGKGHVILIEKVSAAQPGEYVVDDPAGNYFSSPKSHYGAKSCGYEVLYPRDWVAAFTTKRWLLSLGPHK